MCVCVKFMCILLQTHCMIKLNVHVLSKATGVVITISPCISKCLQTNWTSNDNTHIIAYVVFNKGQICTCTHNHYCPNKGESIRQWPTHTSSTGLDWISLSLTRSTLPAWPLHCAKYCSKYLDASEEKREGGKEVRVEK